MYEETICIANATGLHARPASKLVEVCSKYKSAIELHVGEKAVNAKSIMSVLTAGVGSGTEVTLKVSGEDEGAASLAVSEYLHNLPD